MPDAAQNLAMIMRCRDCPMRVSGVCCAMNEASLQLLSNMMLHRQFDAGTELAHQDEANELFAFVLTGVIKLTRILEDGRHQIVGLLSSSDCLGNPYDEVSHDNAECITDVTLCCFPRKQFAIFLSGVPELEHQLLLRANKDLDDAREWLLNLGQKRAGEKVASYLLWLMEKQKRHPELNAQSNYGAVIVNPFRRHEIGAFLGLTVETVSRHFTKLREAGAIALLDARYIEIKDVGELKAISEEGN